MSEPTATGPNGEKVVFRNGAWQPAGASAPSRPSFPGVIDGPPREAPPFTPPSGYTGGPENLTLIPGGPADPSAPQNQPKPAAPAMVPDATAKRAEANVGTFTSLQSAGVGFQDDFGGNPIGGLENVAQSFMDVGTPGQREWWSAFKATDNQIRNDLFGSALTATEKAAYEQTTVSPGMRPEIIRANVERRAGIIREALDRQRKFMLANGYKPEAVDALFAPILQQQDALAATTEQAAESAPTLAGENQPARIPGAGDNPSPVAPAGDGQQADDPTLAGIRGRYKAMLEAKEPPGKIVQWLRSMGVTNPGVLRSAAAQAHHRIKTNTAVDQYNTAELDDTYVPLSTTDQVLNSAGQSAGGAYAVGAANFLTGNNLDTIAGATGGNAERTRMGTNALAQQFPVPTTLGEISGGVMGALGGEAALGGLGVRNALLRGGGADVGMGAFNGAGMADDGNRAMGALAGGGAALAGNLAGNTVAKAARGVANASVRDMRQAGVPMTVGQTFSQSGKVGAAVKGLEDRAAGLPIIGDVINDRRREGIERFNNRAFEKALAPIKGKSSGKVGEEAVEEAQQQVSAAFQTALAGKAAVPDRAFRGHLTAAFNQAAQLPRVGAEVMDGITEILRPYDTQPNLTGEAMQQISRELQALKVSYRNDPLSHRINKAINAVDDAILGMFDRQFSDVIPEYNAARESYRKLSILEDAVLAAKNTEGVFTPAQLGSADKANTRKFSGKRAAARGDGPFHDYQRAAQNVLPNKVPDSGTAGRFILPAVGAAVIGGDAATGDGVSTTGLTIGAVVAGAYSRAGQRLLTKPGRGARAGSTLRNPKIQRAITAGSAATAASLANQ